MTHNKIIRMATVFALPAVWLLILLALFAATSPLEGGPLSVLVAFALIYLLIASLAQAVVFVVYKVVSFLGISVPVTLRPANAVARILALGPVFLLALNTLGQIEVKDVLLVVTFLLIACLYVVRKK